jgi:diguanylate cyclase (GGDEF)-like protein
LFGGPSQSFSAEFLFRFSLVYVTLLCITFWLEFNRSQFIRKSERQSRAIQKKTQLLEEEKKTLQQEINRRLELEAELTTLASTDSLTGLYNRRYFWSRISEELVRAVRYNNQLSLAVIDIDNFKRVNDLYGHPCGDEVIKCIAQYCSDSLRVTDIASRIGGEEFAVLLFHAPISDAVDVMDRLRDKISKHKFTLVDDVVTVTVSIGISTLDKQNTDIDTLYSSADEALYCAKHSGKNCVKKFEQSRSI